MPLTELTLAQWATLARQPNDVVFINDASLTDVMYRLEGSPQTLVINLAYFADLADGTIAGAALDDASVLSAKLGAGTIADDRIASYIVKAGGHLANAVLRASGVYSGGDTITIGTDVFEIDPITTDSTDTCSGGDFNNTTDPLTVELDATAYPVISPSGTGPLVVGELIYIGTEYLRVTVIDGDNVTFERAAGVSTAAAHANTSAIYVSAATVAPTNIPVGVQANFAVAVVTPILAAIINEDAGTAAQANAVTANSLESGAVMVIAADDVGAVVLATTEVGANLAWDSTAMRRGAALAVKQCVATTVVPDSEEVTSGNLYIPLPFDPTVLSVEVHVTATGLRKAWLGNCTTVPGVPPVAAFVLLDNVGTADWDANDTIHLLAIG